MLARAKEKYPEKTQGALVNEALLLLLGDTGEQSVPLTVIPARDPWKGVRSLRSVDRPDVSVERIILEAR